MQESTKSWLTWPIFYTLSEIYQVPLNIIWFILSGAIAYHEFHTVNLINIFLCCLDVMIFDLAVNVADNYFDYRHGKDPHFLTVSNPVGRLKLPIKKVRNLMIILYLISVIPGIILVARTHWSVLILGVIGYFVGIFYTAGKFPINATPFCEAVVAFFISFFIVFVGVYVAVYPHLVISFDTIGQIFAICLPLMIIFYALQLANNVCDLEEDLINGRKTMASFVGKKRGFQVIKVLIIIGMIMPLILAVTHLIPPVTGLVSLWILPTLRNTRNFFTNPDKETTYLHFLKELSVFLILYIMTYTLCTFLAI